MKHYANEHFPHLIHGGDYNPEQWVDTPSVWDEDMRLMKLANCNEMTVGIFAWSALEPQEGKYDFSFLDETIDRVYQNDGRVILATPSGARPHWMADKYPEVLRVDGKGQRLHFSARHNHCFTSPVYREKVRAINAQLAKRYGNHPAVIAWHISNEYGGECYCPLCQNAFRDFLRRKYEGDIGKLNHAYWTSFWSHTYDSFDQIEAPSNLGERSIHGLNLDWKRFVTAQTVDFIKNEIQAIRDGGSD
ncbi:MAG: beta-galactosidase, partial [Eubacteriales bacterium]